MSISAAIFDASIHESWNPAWTVQPWTSATLKAYSLGAKRATAIRPGKYGKTGQAIRCLDGISNGWPRAAQMKSKATVQGDAIAMQQPRGGNALTAKDIRIAAAKTMPAAERSVAQAMASNSPIPCSHPSPASSKPGLLNRAKSAALGAQAALRKGFNKLFKTEPADMAKPHISAPFARGPVVDRNESWTKLHVSGQVVVQATLSAVAGVLERQPAIAKFHEKENRTFENLRYLLVERSFRRKYDDENRGLAVPMQQKRETNSLMRCYVTGKRSAGDPWAGGHGVQNADDAAARDAYLAAFRAKYPDWDELSKRIDRYGEPSYLQELDRRAALAGNRDLDQEFAEELEQVSKDMQRVDQAMLDMAVLLKDYLQPDAAGVPSAPAIASRAG